jgi:hypothetical protein
MYKNVYKFNGFIWFCYYCEIKDMSENKIPVPESDLSSNLSKINDTSDNNMPALESDISRNLDGGDVTDWYPLSEGETCAIRKC